MDDDSEITQIAMTAGREKRTRLYAIKVSPAAILAQKDAKVSASLGKILGISHMRSGHVLLFLSGQGTQNQATKA